MNISETIKNIQSTCNNYVDPELVGIVIHENYYMGTNNINEFEKYNIKNEDTYAEKVLKILEYEHVFLTVGMMTFIPVINECDIYSTDDFNIKLTQDEFDKYSEEKERVFGILLKKDSKDYIIGSCDLCGCSADASFREIEKSEMDFYKKLKEIIDDKIID